MKALAILLLATPLAAQEMLFREVADPASNTFAEAVSLFGRLPACGYAPVRLTLSNGTGRARSASLECRSGDGHLTLSGSEVRSTFQVTAAAHRTEVVDLMVPVTTALTARFGGLLSLSVTLDGDFGHASGALTTTTAPDHPGILLGQALHVPNATALDAALDAAKPSHRWNKLAFAGSFTPAMAPEDWRAYGGFDLLMLTAEEWSALGPGTRTAIRAWNRLGGRLVVFAQDAAATPATLGLAPTGEPSAARSFGLVEVRPIDASLKLDPPATIALVTPPDDRSAPTRLSALLEDTPDAWPLREQLGRRAFSAVPFILVLVAFSVVVGPVNLFVLARSGRRHRLFLTTPAISLGAGALLVLLILFHDGIGGRGARTALVEVRPEDDEHLACLHQEQFSRTGVLLGNRFRIDAAAAISPVPLPPDRWARITLQNGGGGARYQLHPGAPATTASGDWFQSRSEQGHAITAVIPTRGRLERLASTGPPRLLSSFDFPLEVVHFLDESGNGWRANDVRPGTPATCAAAGPDEFQRFLGAERRRLTRTNALRLDRVARRPGHFLATAGSGLLVDTFGAIDWTDDHCLLAGPLLPGTAPPPAPNPR